MKIDEIIQYINGIRKIRTYFSNVFFTKTQLEAMMARGNLQLFRDEGLLLLLEEDADLIRVYFYVQDDTSLEKIKKHIPKYDKPIITDVVGKNPQAETFAKILTCNGFEQYSVFIRMSCSVPQLPPNADVSRVKYATSHDIDSIHELLYSEFDPLFSHIPGRDAIAIAIRKKEITVVRNAQKIAGLAYFEVVSSKKICLRYFVVDRKYRGQGIGKSLLVNTFNYHTNGTIYHLWIGTYNSTIELYRQLNFKQDAMIDYILVFKG